MKTKVILFTLLFCIAGCCDCDQEPRFTHFDITGLTGRIYHVKTINNKDTLTSVVPGAAIDFDRLLIQCRKEVRYYAGRHIPSLFNFTSSAYACKCYLEDQTFTTDERISEISIFSETPFTSTGSVNDNLSKYFRIEDFTTNTDAVVPNQANIKFVNIDSLVNTGPPLTNKNGIIFHLKLAEKPTGAPNQRFTIRYKQTNGETYSFTTNLISLR